MPRLDEPGLRRHRYWRAARAPRYSLTFAFPLLLAYEALAFTLSHDSLAGVRNGADVLLKSAFVLLGGRNGLVAFGALLVGTGVALVWRDRRRSGPLELPRVRRHGGGVRALRAGLRHGDRDADGLAAAGTADGGSVAARCGAGARRNWGSRAQLMISLGAGIYEELLFRVLLVGTLAWIARRLFGWSAARRASSPRPSAR